MNRSGQKLLRMLALAASLLLVTTDGAGQVDEADRYNRCVNNVERMNQLQAQIGSVAYFDVEGIARARTGLVAMRREFDRFKEISPLLDSSEVAEDQTAMTDKVEAFGRPLGLTCDAGKDRRNCAKNMIAGLEGLIDKSVRSQPQREALVRQYQNHATNYIALQCAERFGGTKISGPTAPPPVGDPNAGSYASWMTGNFDTNYGPMQLSTSGGTYGSAADTPGTIQTSKVDGAVMEGTWQQAKSGGRCTYGPFRFTFSAQGFSGVWGYCNDRPAQGWSGSRRK